MNAPLPARRTSAARAGAPTQTALAASDLIPILLHEARRFQLVLMSIFAVIALLALLVGLFLLPRKYEASTSVLAQESDILQPLLENRAVSTRAVDRAGLARQVVFGRKVMTQILAVGGWMEEKPSAVMQDRLIEQIRERTRITNARENLVQITYHDNDAQRAFKVADAMANLLIEESLASKERESREAYEFIDKQVSDYHRKLTDAENNLQAYRSENADAQPGSACRCGQHQIELIALETFKEAAPEPEILFEMTQQGFNSRSAAKALSHRRACCSRLSSGSSSWHQDLRAIDKLSSPVTTIHDGAFGANVGHGFRLVEDFG